MVDNVNSLIMSKKIVLGILLSLILGILGAKASVGGFPVYPSLWLPFKCIGSGDDYWVWITTDDVDIKIINNCINKVQGIMILYDITVWSTFIHLKELIKLILISFAIVYRLYIFISIFTTCYFFYSSLVISFY